MPEPPSYVKAYVAGARGAASVLRSVGVLRWMETRSGSRKWKWARTLVSIHDLDDLVTQDLPWWTMESIALIEPYLAKQPRRVFEYGSGASSVWLARRAGSLVSVEHHPGFAERVSGYLDLYPQAELRVRPPEPVRSESQYRSKKRGWEAFGFDGYVAAIDETDERYDLVAIDGRCREGCLPMAIRHLSPGGVIVLDDTGRRRYVQAMDRTGLSRIDTGGIKVCEPLPGKTSILFDDPTMAEEWRRLFVKKRRLGNGPNS